MKINQISHCASVFSTDSGSGTEPCSRPARYTFVNGDYRIAYCAECLRDALFDYVTQNSDVAFATRGTEIEIRHA